MDHNNLAFLHHLIIFIPCTLPQLVSSPSQGTLTFFTLSLFHQPHVIPHPLVFMVGPYHSCPHVPCLAHGRFYIIRARLVHHQLACPIQRQSSTIRVVVPSILMSSPLLPLVHGLHLQISSLPSIQVPHTLIHTTIFHILFVLMCNMPFISFQFTWPLIHLTLQLDMHFCSSLLDVSLGFARHQKIHTCFNQYIAGDQETLQEKHTKLKFGVNFPKNFENNYKDFFTSISMTMSHTNINTFGGVDLSSVCVRSKQFKVSSNETMATFQAFHPLAKVDFPLFVNDFRLKTKVVSH